MTLPLGGVPHAPTEHILKGHTLDTLNLGCNAVCLS